MVYYNWKPKKDMDNRHEFTSGGMYHVPGLDAHKDRDEWDEAWDRGEGIWVGSHDAREALFFNMQRLMDNGELIFPFAVRPHIYIGQQNEKGENYWDENEVIAKLPEHIRNGIPEEEK